MRREFKFFIGIILGLSIGAGIGNMLIGLSIGIAIGAALSQYKKEKKPSQYIYNFDLFANIPKRLRGKNSEGVDVEEWFNNKNDKYDIFKSIDLDFDYCDEKDLLKNEEEFIVGIRLEDGDSIHEKYLYDEIINLLRRFEEEYETKWEGQFYIEDKKENYICHAPEFKLEIND